MVFEMLAFGSSTLMDAHYFININNMKVRKENYYYYCYCECVDTWYLILLSKNKRVRFYTIIILRFVYYTVNIKESTKISYHHKFVLSSIITTEKCKVSMERTNLMGRLPHCYSMKAVMLK